LEKEPDNSKINFLAVDYLEKAGKTDSALTILNRFILKHPKQQQLVQYFVDVCKKNKEYQRGINLLNKLLETDKNNRRYLRWKSNLEKLIR